MFGFTMVLAIVAIHPSFSSVEDAINKHILLNEAIL
jgi:hypothetical protein